MVDDDGIAFLDTLVDRPRVVWRELTRDISVHTVGRTADQLTALVTAPSPVPGHPSQVELWTWELPEIALRKRVSVPSDMSARPAVVVGGQLVALIPTPDDEQQAIRLLHYGQRQVDLHLPRDAALRANGSVYLAQAGENITVVQPDLGQQANLFVRFPSDAPVRLRHHADVINLWDRAGRIVSATPRSPGTSNSLRTTL